MNLIERIKNRWKKSEPPKPPEVEDPIGDTYHSLTVFSGDTPIAWGDVPKHSFTAVRTGYKLKRPIAVLVAKPGKATSVSYYNRWGDETSRSLVVAKSSTPPYPDGFNGEILLDNANFLPGGTFTINTLSIKVEH